MYTVLMIATHVKRRMLRKEGTTHDRHMTPASSERVKACSQSAGSLQALCRAQYLQR